MLSTQAFQVPAQLPDRPLEPVIEADTVVGRLTLSAADRIIARVLADDGVWEAAETRWLTTTLRSGQTFVDVGANAGYFSVLAGKRVGPAGLVIALEPEPRNHDLLLRNLRRHGLSEARVLPFAAAARAGWMGFEIDERNRGAHRLVPADRVPRRVWCVRLDDLLPERVDVVKIDVQGYDHEVVEGLARTLDANPQLVLLVELSVNELPLRGIDARAVIEGYQALGLEMALFEANAEPHPAGEDEVLDRVRSSDLDFSLLLWRAPPGEPARRPRQAGGLQVTQTAPGRLELRQPLLGRVHELNESASVVFELCSGTRESAEIARAVQEAYRLEAPPVGEIEACLGQLAARRLIC